MAQVEQNPQNGPSAPTPDSLFMEHLKCSICLETLRIPIMTTIGCGHKFCETDIKTALTEDRRCPLCREVVRELFHDVFAEQMLEVYYKQNPNVAQRERCPPWTGPDPLVDVGHTIFGGRNRAFNRVNVQVLAPELPQAERDEISNNIVRLINRENRINELASFDWNGAVGLRPADLIADDYVPFWPPYYDLDSLPQPNPRRPRVRQTARMTSGRASSNPGRGARMSVPSVGGVRRGADASRSRRNAPYGRAPRQTARIRARALSPVSEPRPSRSNNTISRNGQARQLIGPSYPPTSARTLRYLMREFRDPETIRRLRSSPTGTDSSSASLPRVIRTRTPLRAATPRTRRPSTQDSPAPMILRSGRISQRPILYGSNC